MLLLHVVFRDCLGENGRAGSGAEYLKEDTAELAICKGKGRVGTNSAAALTYVCGRCLRDAGA